MTGLGRAAGRRRPSPARTRGETHPDRADAGTTAALVLVGGQSPQPGRRQGGLSRREDGELAADAGRNQCPGDRRQLAHHGTGHRSFFPVDAEQVGITAVHPIDATVRAKSATRA